MTIRLYVDEDSMDQSLVRALRARGVDVTTALDEAMIARDDQAHLACAAAQGRVLYSFNVGDFARLHTRYLTEGTGHAGIVLARQQQYAVGEQMRRLLRLMATLSAQEMTNRMEFLGTWG